MKLLTKAVLTLALLASSLSARPVDRLVSEPFAISPISFTIPLQSMGNGVWMYLLVQVDQTGNATYTVGFYYSEVQG